MLSDNKITEWRERLISMIIENYPNRWETFKSVKENVTAVKYGSGSVYLPAIFVPVVFLIRLSAT